MIPTISACTKTVGEQGRRLHIPGSLLRCEPGLSFRSVTLEAMPLLWRYMSLEGGRTCDFSYGGLLIWAPLFDYGYAICNDTLFIKGRLEGDMSKVAFSLPVGAMPLPRCVAMLRQWCDAQGEALRFSAVPEYALDAFSLLFPREVRPLADWADYLYDIEPLATLSGKKMAKKRNHVNKFEATFPDHEFVPLTPSRIGDARKLLEKITSADTETLSVMESAERRLCALTLDLMAHKQTALTGGILYATGQPVAFTVGDTKGDTLFIHIEKADRDVPGAYEAINKYFAAFMSAQFPALRYINREDDAGDPGLRRAKQSYHPAALLAKYDILF